jgi:hypothetical protein
MSQAGIKLKAKKYHFSYEEIKFIGYLVRKQGIKILLEKIDKIYI